MKTLLMAGVIGTLLSTHAWSATSVRFKDTIQQGSAVIDLFKAQHSSDDLTASALEALRQDHNGMLVFAVDVNENASGTEKATSQGVALASATLTFTTPIGTVSYTDFSTPTYTLVAPENDTTRSFYHTLIGESGSSRITGSTNSDITSIFDALIKFPIDIDLSNVTSATLTIELLQTNGAMGDPEAFYDFSGGFEDVAVLNAVDATFIEELAPGVDEAPLVIAKEQVQADVDTWIYYPSSDSYYVVAYEDQYPERGDYDFNDLIVGYRIGYGILNDQVQSVVAVGYMIARGASYSHDWYLHIPFPNPVNGQATVNIFKPESLEQVSGYPKQTQISQAFSLKVFEDTKNLMTVPGEELANTLPNVPLVKGHKFSVAFDFETPMAFNDVPLPPYDPFLHVLNTGYEIHLPGYATRLNNSTNSGSTDTQYKDAQGYPYALVFPDDWLPPVEYVDLGEAYSQFLDYTLNQKPSAKTWYLSPTSGKTKNIGAAFWKW